MVDSHQMIVIMVQIMVILVAVLAMLVMVVWSYTSGKNSAHVSYIKVMCRLVEVQLSRVMG